MALQRRKPIHRDRSRSWSATPRAGRPTHWLRIIGKQLGENLKISVVIENKTGANGMIAAQAAARAEPDGYTILMVTDAMVTIDPHLATSNRFDLSKAMEPVVNVSWSPMLLAAANNVPANSVAELVALGKQKPQDLSFGSPGSSTPHRLAGEMLQKDGGFTMLNFPTRERRRR